MAVIWTPDRAERLAKVMESDGYAVRRVYGRIAHDATRLVNGLTIASAVYATVWRGSHLKMVINYEWIKGGLL